MVARSSILKFAMTSRLLEAFAQRRIYLSRNDRPRLKVGDIVSTHIGAIVEPYVRFSAGYNLFTMGSFSYSRSELSIGTAVGRYCSIGAGVRVLGRDHPIDRISTSPFTYDPKFFPGAFDDRNITATFTPVRRRKSKAMPVIGNDVWIGDSVILARGIRLGNGSIVAAHSVLTKDVPAYEIWGGAPAKLIRPRFDPELANRLESIAWWQYAFPDFAALQMNLPAAKMAGRLEEMVSAGKLEAFAPESVRITALLEASG